MPRSSKAINGESDVALDPHEPDEPHLPTDDEDGPSEATTKKLFCQKKRSCGVPAVLKTCVLTPIRATLFRPFRPDRAVASHGQYTSPGP